MTRIDTSSKKRYKHTTSFIIKKTQIKTTMNYQFTHTGKAIIIIYIYIYLSAEKMGEGLRTVRTANPEFYIQRKKFLHE